MLRTYKDDLPGRIPLSRQKEFKRIKNIIIGEAVRLGEATQMVETGASDDTDQPRYQSPVPPDQAKTKTLPPGLAIASAASLLHHMGRIFQEQRPQPVAGMRVAVDSKLRQRIREKKIAMGHKPDDHEEEQRMQ